MTYTTNDGLSLMVERLAGGDDTDRPEVRQRLENALVPMVRRAIRTGHGMPAVVRWVQCELADDSPADAERRVRPLAHRLCTLLLDRLQPVALHARETVCA